MLRSCCPDREQFVRFRITNTNTHTNTRTRARARTHTHTHTAHLCIGADVTKVCTRKGPDEVPLARRRLWVCVSESLRGAGCECFEGVGVCPRARAHESVCAFVGALVRGCAGVVGTRYRVGDLSKTWATVLGRSLFKPCSAKAKPVLKARAQSSHTRTCTQADTPHMFPSAQDHRPQEHETTRPQDHKTTRPRDLLTVAVEGFL